MECRGYSSSDDWRMQCCKLNMQFAVSRCRSICGLAPMKAATSHGLTLNVPGAAGESPAPARS